VPESEVKKDVELLRVLLAAKASVNAKDKGGDTPLHLSLKANQSPVMVSALLRCGAAVNVENERKQFPLHLACRNGYPVEVLSAVKEEGLLDREDAVGNTPLSLCLETPSGDSLCEVLVG